MLPNKMNLMGLNRKPANDCLPDGTFDLTPRAIIRGGACLIDESNMFRQRDEITTVTGDFTNLTNARTMFYRCHNLTSVTSEFPALTNGYTMFIACPLTEFNIKLPELIKGDGMFRDS